MKGVDVTRQHGRWSRPAYRVTQAENADPPFSSLSDRNTRRMHVHNRAVYSSNRFSHPVSFPIAQELQTVIRVREPDSCLTDLKKPRVL